ncbi:hypothetical protein MKEN_01258000 [Mycena kentingensis (nom. inval.)]|nr:hypothetical protein MKEN_01258000 [Mycena kentingensis (nom. inval.)]
MHRSLSLARLDVLPVSVKRIALLACKGTATEDHYDRLVDFFIRAPRPQKAAFLPVCYLLLDPELIPVDAGSGDTNVSDNHKELLQRCFTFLDKVLFRIRMPPLAAGPDLWPRAFAWFLFFHNNWHLVAPFGIEPSAELYGEFLCFASMFQDDSLENGGYATSTPGFRTVFVIAWKQYLPLLTDDLRRQLFLDRVYHFLSRFDKETPDNMAEIVDAAGSLDALAGLVVDFLSIIARRTEIVQSSNLQAIESTISFIARFDFQGLSPAARERHDESNWLATPIGPFALSLSGRDVVSEIIRAIFSLLSQTFPAESHSHVGDTLWACFILLERLIIPAAGDMICWEALEAGLLKAIILVSTSPYHHAVRANLRRTLTKWIPLDLIYADTAEIVSDMLPAVDELVNTPEFQQSTTFPHWTTFEAFADKAIGDFEDAVHYGAMDERTCDNIEVNSSSLTNGTILTCRERSITARKPARRATGAKAITGGRVLRMGVCASATDNLTPKLEYRDRRHFRTTIQNDYETRLEEVAQQQLQFMADHPSSSDVFVTLFDYTDAPMQIRVLSVDEMTRKLVHEATFNSLDDGAQRTGWSALVDRARRNRGIFHLHAVKILTYMSLRHLIVPLRFQEEDEYTTLLAQVRKGECGGLRGGFIW